MNNNELRMVSNNKEAIQLLNGSDSDDSVSDIQFSLAPPPSVHQVRRKVRTKRKQRRDPRTQSPSSQSCEFWKILKISLVSFAVGGTLVLGWMVILLHSEVQQLTEKLASFPTSSDDETILGLKRAIKELSQNQSNAFNAILNCSAQVDGFQSKVNGIVTDLGNIKDSLKDAPQMMNIGKELDSLKMSLATYEANLSDLKLGLNELKSSSFSLPSSLDAFNATLQEKFNFITEDLHNHHGMIVSLQNLTDHMLYLSSSQNSSSPSLTRRVDAVQSALVRLEAQQRNTTLRLDSIMQVIQQTDAIGHHN